jgi:hypothetical protein
MYTVARNGYPVVSEAVPSRLLGESIQVPRAKRLPIYMNAHWPLLQVWL